MKTKQQLEQEVKELQKQLDQKVAELEQMKTPDWDSLIETSGVRAYMDSHHTSWDSWDNCVVGTLAHEHPELMRNYRPDDGILRHLGYIAYYAHKGDMDEVVKQIRMIARIRISQLTSKP